MTDEKTEKLFGKMLVWFRAHYDNDDLLSILVDQFNLSFEDIKYLDFDISEEEFNFFEENQAFLDLDS